ncbi:MAG: hypothetical protein KDC05_09835 [Bacteroidales bacterium]|nr:hypothetical protein [Bacteroidales bacterium]
MRSIINKLSVFMMMVFVAVIAISCEKDEDIPPDTGLDYGDGIFIINEGAFNSGSGSVTWYNREGAGRIDNLYQKQNSLVPLGNTAQSMNVINGVGFIVVNNANLVRKVSLKSMQQMDQLENVNLPRFLIGTDNNFAWLTTWDNKVIVFDSENLAIIKKITTGTGPEKLLEVGEEVWVLNQGGYSIDSTVTIIGKQSMEVKQTLMVYPKPTGIQVDKNGLVWIICSGHGWNGWPDPTDSRGHLVCVDPSDYSVVKDLEFPATDQHPEKLEINSTGDILYYIYPGGIYKQETNAQDLQLTKVVNRSGVFYGLDYHHSSDVIIACDAGDFMQNGWVFRYDQTGALIDSLEAGVGPTDVCIPK